MNYQEIMIGNYTYAFGGGDGFDWKKAKRYLSIVDYIGKGFIGYKILEDIPNLYHTHFEPIPLDRDWLLRLGFDQLPDKLKHGNGADWQPDFPKTTHTDLVKNDVTYRFEKFEYYSNGVLKEDLSTQILISNEGTDIKYVHELQNLFMVLYKQELLIVEENEELLK